MKIDGLDYNTQREKLLLPEYGREIQNMVSHCLELPTKEERQQCAETIVSIMDRMNPQGRESADHEQKLWDHLAIMADFKLDIDYPYDVSQALKIATKPEPMGYPMSKIPVRHYGKMMFELFEQLKTMEEGDEKVASDLARFTDGAVQLDLDVFKFDKINPKELQPVRNNKKRR